MAKESCIKAGKYKKPTLNEQHRFFIKTYFPRIISQKWPFGKTS
jgi:hypothetical protein